MGCADSGSAVGIQIDTDRVPSQFTHAWTWWEDQEVGQGQTTGVERITPPWVGRWPHHRCTAAGRHGGGQIEASHD